MSRSHSLPGGFIPINRLWIEGNDALFPSEPSARWYIRNNGKRLHSLQALLKHADRFFFHPERFKAAMLTIAKDVPVTGKGSEIAHEPSNHVAETERTLVAFRERRKLMEQAMFDLAKAQFEQLRDEFGVVPRDVWVRVENYEIVGVHYRVEL